MARRPQGLIIQQPTVSLISGQQLPQASGLGAQVPNIAGPMAWLGGQIIDRQDRIDAEAKREAEKKEAEADALAKRNQAIDDQYYGRQEAFGIPARDERGNYTPIDLPPSDWSPEKRAAFMDQRVDNAMADVRSDLMTRLSSIHARTDIGLDAKQELLNATLEGTVSVLPPAIQGPVMVWGKGHILERMASLRAQAAERQRLNTVEAAKQNILAASNRAVSAEQSGNDGSADRQEIYDGIDRLVLLEDISQEKGDELKRTAARNIAAQGTLARMSDDSRKGRFNPDDLIRMGEVLATNGETTIQSRIPGRPGPLATVTYKASEIRERFQDPATTEKFAQELTKLGVARKEEQKQYVKDKALYQAIHGRPFNTPFPESLRDDFNTKADEWFTAGLHEKPGGLGYIVDQALRAGIVPKSLQKYFETIMVSGDYDKARAATHEWNRLSTYTVNGVEFGRMARRDVGNGLAGMLDAAVAQMAILADKDGNVRRDDWLRFQTAINNPANTVESSIGAFNQNRKPTDTEFGRRAVLQFQTDYEVAMPADFKKEFEQTYHVLRITSSEPDQNVIWEKAWAAMKERWTPNPIFMDGIVRGAKLENPPGYMEEEQSWYSFGQGPDTYQWLNDYTKDMIRGVRDGGILEASDDTIKVLDQLMQENLPLGQGMWLQPTGTDIQRPQFFVYVATPDEGRKRVEVKRNGKLVPLVIDPAYAHDYWSSKHNQQEGRANAVHAVSSALEAKLAEQYLGTVSGGDTDTYPTDMSEEEFRAWFMKQPADFQAGFDQTKENLQEWLEQQIKLYDETEIKEIKGQVGPTDLFAPRVMGESTTDEAILAIESVVPVGDGGLYMKRIAKTESVYGTLAGTFRAEGDKGIFQINTGPNGAFEGVKAAIRRNPNSSVAQAAAKIKTRYGLDLLKASIEDLDKPIVSAAFARLHMLMDPRPITNDLRVQGYIYKDHYNSRLGTGSVEKFIRDAADVVAPLLNPPSAAAAPPVPALPAPPAAGPASPDPADDRFGFRGSITDRQGNAEPANFLGATSEAKALAYRLSQQFGEPLQITPHGGKNRRKDTPTHPAGLAFDFYIGDMDDQKRTRLVATAVMLGYRGLGTYPAGDVGYNTVHFDIRPWKGNGPDGLGLWYGERGWTDAPKWFTDGIALGRRLKSGRAI